MGRYMYTTVTGNWALNQMVKAGWEYVSEEEPGVYLVKKWVSEPKREGKT